MTQRQYAFYQRTRAVKCPACGALPDTFCYAIGPGRKIVTTRKKVHYRRAVEARRIAELRRQMDMQAFVGKSAARLRDTFSGAANISSKPGWVALYQYRAPGEQTADPNIHHFDVSPAGLITGYHRMGYGDWFKAYGDEDAEVLRAADPRRI